MKQTAFKIYALLIILITGVMFTSCELNSIEQPTRVQEISGATIDNNLIQLLLEPGELDFFPKSGFAGTTKVTLTTKLEPSTVLNENLVEFIACQRPGQCEKIAAQVLGVSHGSVNKITVLVPVGATSGEISLTAGGEIETTGLNFTVIPADGLVALYLFDGTAQDKSGNGLHGVVNGAHLTTDRFDEPNKAYSFDGVDDFVAMGNPEKLRITKAITLSAWVKSRSFWYNGILSKTAGSNGIGEGYALQMTATGNGNKFFGAYIAYPGFGPHGINSAGGAGYVENQWVNFTFTIEGDHATYYKNGVKEFEIAYGHQQLLLATQGDFFIGKLIGFLSFEGSIDDVAVYDRALSAYEVRQLYGLMKNDASLPNE